NLCHKGGLANARSAVHDEGVRVRISQIVDDGLTHCLASLEVPPPLFAKHFRVSECAIGRKDFTVARRLLLNDLGKTPVDLFAELWNMIVGNATTGPAGVEIVDIVWKMLSNALLKVLQASNCVYVRAAVWLEVGEICGATVG